VDEDVAFLAAGKAAGAAEVGEDGHLAQARPRLPLPLARGEEGVAAARVHQEARA